MARQQREWRRECERCGTVWYVTDKAARERAPNRMELTGARMTNTGAQISLFGSSKKRTAASTELSRLEEKSARVAAMNSCSSCGSGKFTQSLAD
jgi:hypothetical protein